MSDVIDRSIVEMQFDNRQFESGITQSLNSIQKLKESLNFSKSLDAFETISRSIKSVSFDPMVTIWQTTLARITNMAINAGQRITRALTIEPVFTGFQEYTTQIDAVQTILANTEKYGTTLNDVNKALDELNLYADKTIYNFTQMTSNIGRFTAAGVQLDPAVKSIEGMSNLAASSGATAEQASRAYYQMSQALAGLGLRLMDYNSLVNAGMGGQLFQEALKQTARDVKKTTEEYVKLHTSGMSVEDISKKFGVSIDNVSKILSENYNKDVDEAIKKQGSFRESLSQGWATADILQRTFAKFSSTGMVEYLHMVTGASTLALEELQKIGQQTSFDSKEFNEYAKSIENVTEAQLEEIKANLKQAQTAEDAATKVKTFAQLKDTIKEAVQSGWTQTWEYIIGDFEQAKEFFTRISDYLGNIIGRYSDFRNKIVGDWSRGGGRDAVINGLWNIVKIIEKFVIPLKDAWDKVFPDINVAAVLISISKAFETLTERLIPHEQIVARVQMVYEKIFNVFEVLRYSVGNLIHLMPRLEKALSGSIFAGIFNLFENRAYAEYRGDTIKYFQKLYDVISDISDKEVSGLPGMEGDGKTKLADYAPYQRILKSLANFWSSAQDADISKFGRNASDIEKLNDSLLKMAFGIENGNKAVSKFSSMKRDDFLRYLQEEYGVEVEIAEDIYRLIEKLNKIETDIIRQIELAPMKELLVGKAPANVTEVLVTAIADIFGVDPYQVLDTWNMVQMKINEGLRKLSFAFNDTVKALKTIDMLLGALVYLSISEISEHVVKPIYLFAIKYFTPAILTIYEAIHGYAIPALDAITAGLLILVKYGLENVFDNFSSRIEKMMPVLETFGLVMAAIANIMANTFYEAMRKLANINPNTMLRDLGKTILGFFTTIDSAFKKWAGFSLVDVFDMVFGDIKWFWEKIANAFKITEGFGEVKDKLSLVVRLWMILLQNGVYDLSVYISAFENVFGKLSESKFVKILQRLGKVLNGVFLVVSAISEQFKIFVDNPASKTLPERIMTFMNRVYDAFVSALRINGVSERVIKVFNFIFYFFRDFVMAIADLISKVRDKLDYKTVGIRAYFDVFFDMLTDFVEKHKLVVQSLGTAAAMFALAIAITAIIAYVINTGYTLGEALMAMVKWLTPKVGWGYVKDQLVQTLNDIGDMADDISRAFKIASVIAIVGSIAILAGTLYLLTTLDYDKVIQALGVLLVMMGSVWLLTMAITKLTRNGELTMTSALFTSLALTIAAMAVAMFAINAVWESSGGLRALGAVGLIILLLGAIGGIVLIMNRLASRTSAFALPNMILLGDSVQVMAKTVINMAPAIYLLSKLPWEDWWKAIIGMAVIFGGMALYSAAAGKIDTGSMITAATVSMSLALAMVMMVGALKLLTMVVRESMDWDRWEEILLAMGFMAGLMILIGGITALAAFGDWKSFLASVPVLLSIAAVIGTLAVTMSLIAFVASKCMGGLIAATVAMGALLVILGSFVGLFALLGVLAEAGVGVIPLVAVAGGLLLIGMTALELGASLLVAGIGATKFAEAFERCWAVIKDIGSAIGVFASEKIEKAVDTGKSFAEFWESDFVSKISTILGKLLKLVNSAIDNLIGILDFILPTLTKFADELLPRIDEFLHKVTDALATYVPRLLTYVANVLTALIKAINEFGPPLVSAITELIKWVFDIVIPWLSDNMPGWLEKLTPVLKAILEFLINGIADLLVALDSRAEDIATSILSIINHVLDAMTYVADENTGKMRIQEIFEKLYSVLEFAVTGILPKLAELFVKLISVLTSTLVSAIMALILVLDTLIEGIVDHIADHIADHINHITDALERNKEPIIEALDRFINTIGAFLLDALNRLFGKETHTDPDTLSGRAWMMGLGTIGAFIVGLLALKESIRQKAKEVFLMFINTITNTLGLNKDGSAKPGEGIHKIGYSILTAIKAGITGAWDVLFGPNSVVKSIGSTVWSTIHDALSYDKFKTIGENIVRGIINGINLWSGTLRSTVNSVFGESSGLLKWIMDALEESSPSKATQRMGVYVDKGLESGLIKEKSGMMDTVDNVFGEGTGVMEGIRDALGVHSESWKTHEYAEDVDGGAESGLEDGEKSLIDKAKEVFGNFIDTIKGAFSTDGTNPISSLLSGFISDWDPDKGLMENLSSKLTGLFSGDKEGGGFFSDIIEKLTGDEGPLGKLFGEDGPLSKLFGEGGALDFSGFLQNADNQSLWPDLFDNVGDIKYLSDINYDDIGANLGVGQTLGDGKLDTSVAKANNRTITSNGTYANTMNDMLNSGQYWNDPNALTNADIVNAIATVVQRLDNIDENMPKEVVLDTGAMVGNLSPEMNKALGRMLRQKGRRT